jgi:serine/threonine protein kinase
MPANPVNGNSDSQDFYNGGGMMANGRFMITKSIGKGSFGEIFQGLDTQTNKEVAIKMVSARLNCQALIVLNTINHLYETNLHTINFWIYRSTSTVR